MIEAPHIVVCVKQVPDPEGPASSFKLDPMSKTIIPNGVPPVINPCDENALELALRIKESLPEAHISAISFGSKLARSVFTKVLAVGCDSLYLIRGPAVDDDSYLTAAILASAIREIGFDLVLAGRQASDTNSGGVGLALSERLGIPAISWVRKVEISGECLIVERVVPEGYEILRGSMPALVTVSHEAGELRIPKLSEIRKSGEKAIHNLNTADLNLGEVPDRSIECIRLESPVIDRQCRFIDEDTPADAGIHLARIIVGMGY